MAFKPKNRQFFDNKPMLSVPDLRTKPIESSTNNLPAYKGKISESSFQKLRDYDAKLNTIDINVVGAAPIFGKENKVQLTQLLDDKEGLFTGSLNDAYANDDFLLLSTIKRDIKINYWGMNIKAYDPKLLVHKSFYNWETNVQFLETKIKEAMYTDLAVFNWTFQEYTESGTTFSKYDKVMSTLSYMLYSYQTNIFSLMITILNYEYIVTQLPKLQELYKGKADYFVHIQNQLKRSMFTAPIRALMTWLKRRFVDDVFFKKYILPTAVVSKATDGLNSPLIYLSQTIDTPIQPIVKVGIDGRPVNTTSVIPVTIFGNDITITRGQDSKITAVSAPGMTNGIHSITHNAFDLDTLMSLVLSAPTVTDFKTTFQSWINTALTVIQNLNAQTLDLSRESWFIDLESALAKLASAPGSLNWKQNINFTSLPPVIEYTNYQLVNDLVTFACSEPMFATSQDKYTDTGYRLLLPMFRRKGLPLQLVKEATQVYYLPSDTNFYSVISLGSKIQFRTRNNDIISATVEYKAVAGYPAKLPFFKLNKPFSSIAYLVLQDYFTFVIDSENKTWTNPDFMTFVTASYQNRWADFIIEASRDFIIPQA